MLLQAYAGARYPVEHTSPKGDKTSIGEIAFFKNQDYESIYEACASSGAQPRLAAIAETHEAWAKESWSDCNADQGEKSFEYYAMELLAEKGQAVSWRGKPRLFYTPRMTEIAAEEPVEAARGAEKALESAVKVSDLLQSKIAAKLADKAANLALNRVRKVAQPVEDHKFLSQDVFD
ncbi:hypothetical protein HRG_007546 [Hirsutella rhossiliensis]|uniref:Uncharacterized protein n=1 Tax=Hirsutella rhossiliensis TaxID=111463 RepID=A0A9P8MSP7_9HYPO|nr:uncharacterized protein HRG_07546 [Hirsutella rhossiliensis]KAH0961468.1 hypothetical protein HRG_07546 [Hirsutella rhossiliensis]